MRIGAGLMKKGLLVSNLDKRCANKKAICTPYDSRKKVDVKVRTILAILFAPLIPAVIWGVLISGFFYALFFSYLSFVLVGLPVIFLLKRTNHYSLIYMAFCGGFCGIMSMNLILRAFAMLLGSPTTSLFDLNSSLWGLGYGSLVAIIYWLIDAANIASK